RAAASSTASASRNSPTVRVHHVSASTCRPTTTRRKRSTSRPKLKSPHRSSDLTQTGRGTTMARSVYLARLIGPPLVIIALGMLIDQGGFMELSRNFMADPALIYVASAAGLFVGLAIVLAHNVWTPDWRVLITLLGWVSMLDSASWMLARRQITDVWRPLLDSTL